MEVVLVTDAVTASLNHADLIVQPFDEAQGHSVLRLALGHDAVPVPVDHRRKLFEGGNAFHLPRCASRSQRTHPFEQAAIWLPLQSDGKPRKEVSVAPLSRLLLVAADSVWGVRADDDGLESLLRCAVRSPQ